MTRSARFPLLAAVALALTPPASFAKGDDHNGGKPAAPSISRVTAQPFQLTQTKTEKLSDTTTRSAYAGTAVLTITPSDTTVAATTLNVAVQLYTETTLNTLGDGFTNGSITLTDAASGQSLYGDLAAVNQNFGQLEGVIQGGARGGRNAVGTELRAVFTGTFVQDANGNYTTVNADAHGVLVTQTSDHGGPGSGHHNAVGILSPN